MLCLRGLARKGTVEEPVDRVGSVRVRSCGWDSERYPVLSVGKLLLYSYIKDLLKI
jgi:hypothetical protein